MNIEKIIKDLEKKKIISRRPAPVIPFILFLIALSLGVYIDYLGNRNIATAFFAIAGFTLIFAIIHWIVVRVVSR
jgi:MFS-type transporter involved in bile tolerance (Atg22 family)